MRNLNSRIHSIHFDSCLCHRLAARDVYGAL